MIAVTYPTRSKSQAHCSVNIGQEIAKVSMGQRIYIQD